MRGCEERSTYPLATASARLASRACIEGFAFSAFCQAAFFLPFDFFAFRITRLNRCARASFPLAAAAFCRLRSFLMFLSLGFGTAEPSQTTWVLPGWEPSSAVESGRTSGTEPPAGGVTDV